MTDTVRTLLMPFDTGDLPAPTGRWAFVNAVAHDGLRAVFADAALLCEQPFRPDFLDLRAAGFDASAAVVETSAHPVDGALVLLGKHRRLNEARIASASQLTRRGAPVVIAGAKNLGVASARKWAAGRTPIDGAMAKHHAQVFWFAADADAFADVTLATTTPAPGMTAAPGMFSADRIDAGSALLAAHIDHRLAGAVADFGAGWGWLSAQVLRNGRPSSLDLIEADRNALKAAVANVEGNAVPITGYWLDLTRETAPRPYDAIIMNPPFHTGRASEPDLGQRFITAAADALAPGGRLVMVANRRLPYERALSERFGSLETLADEAGFKVIAATGVRNRRHETRRDRPSRLR